MEIDTLITIVGIVGFALSEIIAANPKWKSNSILQVVAALLRNSRVKK